MWNFVQYREKLLLLLLLFFFVNNNFIKIRI